MTPLSNYRIDIQLSLFLNLWSEVHELQGLGNTWFIFMFYTASQRPVGFAPCVSMHSHACLLHACTRPLLCVYCTLLCLVILIWQTPSSPALTNSHTDVLYIDFLTSLVSFPSQSVSILRSQLMVHYKLQPSHPLHAALTRTPSP